MPNIVTRVKSLGNYGKYVVLYSKKTVRDGTVPIVIIHHGHLGNSESLLDPNTAPGSTALVNYLCQKGFIVVSGDFKKSGNTGNGAQWGNDDNYAGLDEAFTYGIAVGGDSTKAPLHIGISMGASVVLGYAGRYSGRSSGVIAILPAIDILTYYLPGDYGPFEDGEPFSFAYTIVPAYGGTFTGTPGTIGSHVGGYSEPTHGPTHNPQNMANNTHAFATKPIQLWYAKHDTLAAPELVRSFYDAVVTQDPDAPIEMHRIPGQNLDHSDISVSNVPKSLVVDFAQECMA